MDRDFFAKSKIILNSFLLGSLVLNCVAASPVDHVNPFIGTGGHGHTYPGATMPFGMVQLSPDTRTEDWDACAGYHYSDKSIRGFSHIHLSGTGIREGGDLLVLPVTGELGGDAGYKPLAAKTFASEFSHDRELAQPGYYKVLLDKYKVTAELTATTHAGMHRYTFPASTQSHILIDLVHGLESRPTDVNLRIESDTLLTGYRRSDGWARGIVVYFAMESSQPFKSAGLELDGKPMAASATNAQGRQIRGHLDYETTEGQQILLRVGLSPTSVEEARKNLAAEIPSWNFDAVRDAARNNWNENLSRLTIESSNPNIRQTFYSALYHTMLAPTTYNDADGSYRGPDGEVHPNPGFQFYTTFSLWDTFRAEHPLLTLTQPERVNDFIRTFLAFYQESPNHSLPMWPVANYETWCMIGYHSVPVIWDAYAKGFRDYDTNLALKAMHDTAMGSRNEPAAYEKLGYLASEPDRRRNGTARTLEYSFDDWCIAQMAKAVGNTEHAELFSRRSQYYTNVFDPGTGFFRGKSAAGTFRETFDARAINFDDFVEANAWHYAFAVLHDVPEMIKLHGGNEAFVKKLDQMFDADSDIPNYLPDMTGLVGQYAHGNEPCHHVAYLYALAGAQYQTARRVHQIMQLHYDNTPEGICGNDDCGQMSAWYVWSAIGLYPLNPANGIYVIGSPVVEKATFQLNPKHYKDGTFTVVARKVSNQNIYVQSAKLNGQPLNRPWVTHEEVVSGGTLELEMGVLPNKKWGASLQKAPAP
jgi:predicted alpha-1,2-mannosidase